MSEIESLSAEVMIPPTVPQRLEIVVRDVREAAPTIANQPPPGFAEVPSVSLRDWFAGQALSGYIVKGGGNSVQHITVRARNDPREG